MDLKGHIHLIALLHADLHDSVFQEMYSLIDLKNAVVCREQGRRFKLDIYLFKCTGCII